MALYCFISHCNCAAKAFSKAAIVSLSMVVVMISVTVSPSCRVSIFSYAVQTCGFVVLAFLKALNHRSRAVLGGAHGVDIFHIAAAEVLETICAPLLFRQPSAE